MEELVFYVLKTATRVDSWALENTWLYVTSLWLSSGISPLTVEISAKRWLLISSLMLSWIHDAWVKAAWVVWAKQAISLVLWLQRRRDARAWLHLWDHTSVWLEHVRILRDAHRHGLYKLLRVKRLEVCRYCICLLSFPRSHKSVHSLWLVVVEPMPRELSCFCGRSTL